MSRIGNKPFLLGETTAQFQFTQLNPPQQATFDPFDQSLRSDGVDDGYETPLGTIGSHMSFATFRNFDTGAGTNSNLAELGPNAFTDDGWRMFFGSTSQNMVTRHVRFNDSTKRTANNRNELFDGTTLHFVSWESDNGDLEQLVFESGLSTSLFSITSGNPGAVMGEDKRIYLFSRFVTEQFSDMTLYEYLCISPIEPSVTRAAKRALIGNELLTERPWSP